jgi:hypothetical protein
MFSNPFVIARCAKRAAAIQLDCVVDPRRGSLSNDRFENMP